MSVPSNVGRYQMATDHGWRDALLLLLLSTLPLVAGPLATNDATSTLITRSMANIDVREREEMCNLQYVRTYAVTRSRITAVGTTTR